MSIKGKIKTLFSDKNKTEVLFPRTKVSAVSDDNGVGLNVLLEQTVPMTRGGTGAENGAEGLANMFAAGSTVLSPYQYGTELPTNAAVGQVYFEEATGTIADIGQDVAKAVRAVNLLDNSDFRNPVNQRGASGSIPAWTYFIDRWRTMDTTTVSYSDGLVVNGKIHQIMASNFNGKTLTLAAKINGKIGCCSGVISKANSWTQYAVTMIDNVIIAINKWEDDVMHIAIESTSQFTIEWAALYEGEYTVETLPPYVPKGYGAELLECQRYDVEFPNRILIPCAAAEGGVLTGNITLPTNLREGVTPTITVKTTVTIRGGGKNINPNTKNYSVTSVAGNCMQVRLDTEAGIFTAYETYLIYAEGVSINCDL